MFISDVYIYIFLSFKAVTRTGSTPLLSCRSQMSLLQHTILEEHRKHKRGVSQESSPIIMKVTEMAKMCDATVTTKVQVLMFVDTVRLFINHSLGVK
jgi:hypothetical protein